MEIKTTKNIKKSIINVIDQCRYLLRQLSIVESVDFIQLQGCLYELNNVVYAMAKGCGNPAVIEFEYKGEAKMAEKYSYEKSWRLYARSPFAKMLSMEALPAIISVVEKKALAGDLNAARLILDKIYPNARPQTFSKGLNIRKIDTQADVDEAMNKIVEAVTYPTIEERMSLEAATQLADLIITKKNTMDECILGEVIKIKEQLGLIES